MGRLFAADRVRDAFAVTAAAVADTGTPDHAAVARSMTLEDFLAAQTEFVNREHAHAVPAYRRARTLIAQTLAGCSIKIRPRDGRLIEPGPFLRQPDPSRTAVAFWADIIGDLADYGVAYAVNTSGRFGYADAKNPYKRKHLAVERVDPENVLATPDGYDVTIPATDVWGRLVGPAETRHYPASHVVAFESDAGAWLRYGARAITTARMLEDAARTYASTPSPTTVLSNSGPRKTPEQVIELLDAFETARRTRSTAYTGRDITIDSFGFDATQIALTDARSAAVLDIARLTGVPSIYLSQGPNDASLTYSNMTQQRLDLLNAIQPFATAIEQRLSFDDVTGEGTTARFDFSAWFRTDPKFRAEIASIYVPLGVLSPNEVREYEDLAPSNNAPTTPEVPGAS